MSLMLAEDVVIGVKINKACCHNTIFYFWFKLIFVYQKFIFDLHEIKSQIS